LVYILIFYIFTKIKIMELQIGNRVLIIKNESGSNNRVGEIGIITRVGINKDSFLVEVKPGKTNGCWHADSDLELIEEQYEIY